MIKTSFYTLIDCLLFYTVLVDFVLRNRVDVRFFSSPELKNNLKLDEILSCFESILKNIPYLILIVAITAQVSDLTYGPLVFIKFRIASSD